MTESETATRDTHFSDDFSKIIDLIGPSKARNLVIARHDGQNRHDGQRQHGPKGSRSRKNRTAIFVPAKFKDDHWMVRLLGREDAEKLTEWFWKKKGKQYLTLPTGLKYARVVREHVIRELEGEGASVEQLAEHFQMTEAKIREILKRPR